MIQGIAKALVVEDMLSQQQAMATLLSQVGVEEILTAEDGVKASAILKQQHRQIDIVFTDLQMPNMDGLQLIEFLGEINYSGCVFICSHMEQKIIDLAIELARRKSIHLIGCIDKTLDEALLKVMLHRAKIIHDELFVHDHLLKKRELRESLEQKCVVPYYQPQIDISTNKVIGFEVLCRLHLPGSSLIMTPDMFIPVANKFDLANQLTFTLMDIAVLEFKSLQDKLVKENRQTNLNALNMSINICPSQLDSDDLPLKLKAICDKYDFPPKQLTIEITEADVIETDTRLKNLDRLRLLGFGCSLDDFGMGFTSIRQLNNYPFTEVKFDKSLVIGIEQDNYSQRLCEQLYDIRKTSNINFVVEGIETPSQAEYFDRYENITLQGFFISRPKPLDEIRRWYRAWLHQHGEG